LTNHPSSRVHVIVNPASGLITDSKENLKKIIDIAGYNWSFEVTKKEGDATNIATRLADEGVEIVAAYGGDGTISEVACGLAGTNTLLGVLPGGTGNVLAYEFGTPRNLTRAVHLLVSDFSVRLVDMGRVNQRTFLIRASTGLEAITVLKTQPPLKKQIGVLAYGLAGLKALMEVRPVKYTIETDDKRIETEGVLCSVANASHLGLIPRLSLGLSVDMTDGYLDLIVMDRIDLQNTIAVLVKEPPVNIILRKIQHWQIKQATILAEPAQATQADGDMLGVTPFSVSSMPKALKVIVPK